MKILYVALNYDYGDPARGLSFEYYNFYETLRALDGGKYSVINFPFDVVMREYGRDRMNQMLLEIARREQPDLCFFFLFTNEIYQKTLNMLRLEGFTTFNWFADDQWRWFNFSRHYAPLFTWFSTTDGLAYKRYRSQGMSNVIRTQWACNPDRINGFKERDERGAAHGVTFVGQAYGERLRLANYIKKNQIELECFGEGWPYGRLSRPDMIRIFMESRINLNFAGSSAVWSWRSLARIFINRQSGALYVASPRDWFDNIRSEYARLTQSQIKGRLFEVPATGGFLLTAYAPGLEDYYEPGKELAVFRSRIELIKQIRYYLTHDTERQDIARRGQERTLREHTYAERFRQIFKMIGFSS